MVMVRKRFGRRCLPGIDLNYDHVSMLGTFGGFYNTDEYIDKDNKIHDFTGTLPEGCWFHITWQMFLRWVENKTIFNIEIGASDDRYRLIAKIFYVFKGNKGLHNGATMVCTIGAIGRKNMQEATIKTICGIISADATKILFID